jgi:putative Holliday junction resolvase
MIWNRRQPAAPGCRLPIRHARRSRIRENPRLVRSRAPASRRLYVQKCYAESVRVLGIDYGQRRIGLALSDATGLLARPWKTLIVQGGAARAADALAAEITRLLAEDDGLAAVVLGFPRRLNGEPNEQTAKVEKLANSLRGRLTVPLVLQDERLTSREAERLLAARIKDWRKRKALLDAASAAVILQDYLDSGESIARSKEDEAR